MLYPKACKPFNKNVLVIKRKKDDQLKWGATGDSAEEIVDIAINFIAGFASKNHFPQKVLKQKVNDAIDNAYFQERLK